jgi:hypothetical protein
MSGYREGAKGQRTAADRSETWEAGKYVLLADRYTVPGMEGGSSAEMVRGDDVVLESDEATRLGNAGVIATPTSAKAEEAKATPGTRSADTRA